MSRTRGHDAIVAGSEGTEQMTTENANLPSSHVAPNAESSASDVARFAQVLRAHAPYDGRFELRVPGVYAIRASRTTMGLLHTVHDPALCIIAHGTKRLLLGQEDS